MGKEERDWGRYFRQVFDEAREFSNDLLAENERLRAKIALLEHRSTVERGGEPQLQHIVDELQALRSERSSLQAELEDLKARFQNVQEENAEFSERFVTIETQNANLASLYVASYQLHSTLSLDEVLLRINEVVINLVGAESFGIYLFDEKRRCFTLTSAEVMPQQIGYSVPWGENLLTEVAQSARLYLADDAKAAQEQQQPIAAVPLIASDELMGVLIVNTLLIQKSGLEPLDLELFDLLAGHAATALMAAQLYTRSQRRANTLQSFVELLKESAPSTPAPSSER